MGNAIKELSQSQEAESLACAELFAGAEHPSGIFNSPRQRVPICGLDRLTSFLCLGRSVLARGCCSGIADLSLERGKCPGYGL